MATGIGILVLTLIVMLKDVESIGLYRLQENIPRPPEIPHSSPTNSSTPSLIVINSSTHDTQRLLIETLSRSLAQTFLTAEDHTSQREAHTGYIGSQPNHHDWRI